MNKRLYILFLLTFTVLFLTGHAHDARSLTTTSGKTTKETICDRLQRRSSEPDLIYHYISTGSRVTPVQKGSFSGSGCTCLPFCALFFSHVIGLPIPSSFCKDYIDHIYPSHHFW